MTFNHHLLLASLGVLGAMLVGTAYGLSFDALLGLVIFCILYMAFVLIREIDQMTGG